MDTHIINLITQLLFRCMIMFTSMQQNLTDLQVVIKEDGSKVSDADLTLHKMLIEGLQEIYSSSIAYISEEEDIKISRAKLLQFYNYFLIDPIDGTSAFLKGKTNCTINLCWMVNRSPSIGWIAHPAENKIYYGNILAKEAYIITVDHATMPLNNYGKSQEGIKRLLISHRNKEAYHFPEVQAVGSALKFCKLVEGKADIFIQPLPTYIWDIAAGEAIIRAAGGCMYNARQEPIEYNNLESQTFIAVRDATQMNSDLFRKYAIE